MSGHLKRSIKMQQGKKSKYFVKNLEANHLEYFLFYNLQQFWLTFNFSIAFYISPCKNSSKNHQSFDNILFTLWKNFCHISIIILLFLDFQSIFKSILRSPSLLGQEGIHFERGNGSKNIISLIKVSLGGFFAVLCTRQRRLWLVTY